MSKIPMKHGRANSRPFTGESNHLGTVVSDEMLARMRPFTGVNWAEAMRQGVERVLARLEKGA